ncbi:Uncharacterised protein [Anaerostipes hadrus]|uniref:Uncharacterized protein n=1 Tax=Anaerostipes hadrus TaxID=649756 RepID=A0A174UJK6_ANAHA|nr:hypothetical protein [Anaerostipes hadrus]CUQ22744.1 Uncharacterised protein [Anaerostipes hadrus]
MKEFAVKLIMELVDMANSGMISFIVTVVATRYMTKNKIDKRRIKKRANASQTSAQDKHDSEEHTTNKSSDITKYADIHDNIGCDIQVNIYPDQKSDQ